MEQAQYGWALLGSSLIMSAKFLIQADKVRNTRYCKGVLRYCAVLFSLCCFFSLNDFLGASGMMAFDIGGSGVDKSVQSERQSLELNMTEYICQFP